MFLAGTVFFVGSLLKTLIINSLLDKNPEWFLFIPYYGETHAGAVLGLALIISGLTLIVFGIASGINYSRDRNWYMTELRKANSIEEVLMSRKQTLNETKPTKPKTAKKPKQ
jgi:hypothetical protein